MAVNISVRLILIYICNFYIQLFLPPTAKLNNKIPINVSILKFSLKSLRRILLYLYLVMRRCVKIETAKTLLMSVRLLGYKKRFAIFK